MKIADDNGELQEGCYEQMTCSDLQKIMSIIFGKLSAKIRQKIQTIGQLRINTTPGCKSIYVFVFTIQGKAMYPLVHYLHRIVGTTLTTALNLLGTHFLHNMIFTTFINSNLLTCRYQRIGRDSLYPPPSLKVDSMIIPSCVCSFSHH